MKTAILTFPLLLSTLLASTGCGSDKQRTVYVIEDDPYAGDPYEPEPEPEPDPFVPPFQAFEIPIAKSITVGAFVLELESVRVEPRDALGRPYAKVLLSFWAHNTSQNAAAPLSELDFDGLVLEVGGKYFWGEATADAVPGGLDGDGTLAWLVTEESSPELIAEATIMLGASHQNQAVIPLAAPAETVTLADLPVAGFTIVNGEKITLEVNDARVQFNARGGNEPLPAGTAWLLLGGVISGGLDINPHLSAWDDEDFYLERPDGVSVVGSSAYTPVRPGTQEVLSVNFEIEQPVEGTYTLGITRDDQELITQTIVVP